MKIITRAYSILRKYPALTGMALAAIVAASFFEGASFGMLIPLIQSFTNSKVSILTSIPIINKLNFLSSSVDQPKAISFIFLLLFILLVIKNVFTYLSNILIARLRFGLIRDLSVNLMDKLADYDIAYFNSVKTGYLISSVNVDTDRIGNFILAILQFIALLGRVLVYIALLFLISVKISVLIFILVAIVLLPLEIIVKKLKTLGSKISQTVADYNYKLIEIFTGIRLIKTCGAEDLEKKNFKIAADRVYALQYKSNKYIYLLIPISEVLIFGLITAFLTILFNNAKINVTGVFPFTAAYLVVLVRTLTQLNLLNSLRSQAVHNSAFFKSYEDICDEKDKKSIGSGRVIIDMFSDSVEFKDVSFAYAGNKYVLADINIRIPKGNVTAIIGASGVGKSTMVNLILRFYDVTSGTILVDGTDIKNLDLKGWRRKIGLVSQDIFLFNTTVRNNISYGLNKIKDKDVFEAARKAFAHDFITALPEKYDTVLGERGVRLSGGQKQRISIARAIIHNPEILILDEATSSLDTETELLIKRAIDRLTSDRTVIAIAHRLSTIVNADNIIVLEEGRVVESGTHPDLIGKKGLYKRLYDTQFNTQKMR